MQSSLPIEVSPSPIVPNAAAVLEPLERRVLMAADPVLDWNEALLDAVRVDKTAPPVAARAMAMVHTAVYDAVNAIQHDGHRGYLYNHPAPRVTSVDAAVAQAAHDVLAALFPAQAAAFDAKLASTLAAVRNGPGERFGTALGKTTARLILNARKDDGASATAPYTTGTDAGEWQATPPAFRQDPLLPQWPDVTPFALSKGDQFRPAPPPALTSAEYAAAFDEVKSLGSVDSTTRTADQTQIARFWADGAGTATPPGHWNEIAQDVAREQGNTVFENARMFALLNIAEADAGIACWDAKYEYNFWRPVTAIRAAGADGNPATQADPAWTPLLATPPFPSYTSGHSTFSAAAATVLSRFYGTDDVTFTTTDDDVPGAVRSFSSFSDAAAEAGMSRIYGGIHYQFDNAEGLHCGEQVGNWVADRLLTDTRPGNSNPGQGGKDDRDGKDDRGRASIASVARDILSGALNRGSLFGNDRRIL